MLLRHGRLRMCRKGEAVRSGHDGRGMFVVISGLVRIGYRDPLGNTQQYFLATGARMRKPVQALPHAGAYRQRTIVPSKKALHSCVGRARRMTSYRAVQAIVCMRMYCHRSHVHVLPHELTRKEHVTGAPQLAL